MSVLKCPEPAIDHADLDEWSTFISRTTNQMCGCMICETENMYTSDPIHFKAGSRFELNGALYYIDYDDEPILGTPVDSKTNFVYAVVNVDDDIVRLEYSDVEPSWSAAKGGWFNGNNRALMKFYYLESGDHTMYGNKVFLESHKSMQDMNYLYILPDYVIGLIITSNGTYLLQPGIYRVEMRGGHGGHGGAGGIWDGQYRNEGYPGTVGQSGAWTFTFLELTTINVRIGRDGAMGSRGDDMNFGDTNGTGDGGDGGNGEGSYILIPGATYSVGGGSGGAGGDGTDNPSQNQDYDDAQHSPYDPTWDQHGYVKVYRRG